MVLNLTAVIGHLSQFFSEAISGFGGASNNGSEAHLRYEWQLKRRRGPNRCYVLINPCLDRSFNR